MLRYEAGLREMIAQDQKLSVRGLCKVTNRKLGDFKYRYGSMAKFISALLEHKINGVFSRHKKGSLSRILTDILHMMHDDRKYYHTLFKLISSGRIEKRNQNNILVYRKMERIFTEKIEDYVKQNGVLRMRDIEGSASHICARIQVWVLHELEDTPQTIYHELRTSIDRIEAAKGEED